MEEEIIRGREQLDVKKSQELVYLATPYSHPDSKVQEMRFLTVNKAAVKLLKAGVYLFSPISQMHSIAIEGELPKDWEFWKGYCEVVLAKCDRLLVLKQDGWEQSIGIAEETKIAKRLGIPVEYMDPE